MTYRYRVLTIDKSIAANHTGVFGVVGLLKMQKQFHK